MVRRARRLEEQGALTYEVCRNMPVPEAIITGLVRHKMLWCEQQGKQGLFDQPNVLEFSRQLIEEAARNGTLFLAWLKCGDSIIAHHLGFQHGKKLYGYTGAYDAAWVKYSPGHIMTIRAIVWAIENGLEEYDQMQGEFAYKHQFANGARECKEYTFYNSLKGWLGAELYIKRRAIKRAIHQNHT